MVAVSSPRISGVFDEERSRVSRSVPKILLLSLEEKGTCNVQRMWSILDFQQGVAERKIRSTEYCMLCTGCPVMDGMGRGGEDPRIFSALGEAIAARSPRPDELTRGRARIFQVAGLCPSHPSLPFGRIQYSPDSGRCARIPATRSHVAPSSVDNSKDARVMGTTTESSSRSDKLLVRICPRDCRHKGPGQPSLSIERVGP